MALADECDAITGALGLDRRPERVVGDVRDIDHHAEPVHLQHNLLAERREPIGIVRYTRLTLIARRVRPVERVRPGQRHVADPEPVVVAQQPERIVDGVAALDAHQRRQLMVAVGNLDIGRGEGHPHPVGMLRRLVIHRIDQIESTTGVLSLVQIRLNPDRKKLRPEITFLRDSKLRLPPLSGSPRS